MIIHSEVTLQESVGEDGRIKAPEGRKVDLKGIVMMPAPLRFLINRELEEQILDALGGAEVSLEFHFFFFFFFSFLFFVC